MDKLTLAKLEQAIEPYRQAGFIVTSQSEGAITLARPPEKFSYAFFIFMLILLWPIAVIYLIAHNNQGAKIVCVRVTSQGQVEESGYTLAVMRRAYQRRRRSDRIIITTVVIAFSLILLLIIYHNR
jgi:hypothetical protein